MANVNCTEFRPTVAIPSRHRGSWLDLLAAGFGIVLTWQERAAQRAHLAAIDDHLLKDMGLTRAEAMKESRKPFWRG